MLLEVVSVKCFPSLLSANGFEPGAQTSSEECDLEESCGYRAEGEPVLPFLAASFVAGGLSVDSLQSEIKVKREGRNHGRPDLEGTRVTI